MAQVGPYPMDWSNILDLISFNLCFPFSRSLFYRNASLRKALSSFPHLPLRSVKGQPDPVHFLAHTHSLSHGPRWAEFEGVDSTPGGRKKATSNPVGQSVEMLSLPCQSRISGKNTRSWLHRPIIKGGLGPESVVSFDPRKA